MEEAQVSNHQNGRRRVLIVDDSPGIRKRLGALAKEVEGVEVAGDAADAQEALDLCRELEPDVMTLDLRLPGESGLEVLERLQGLPNPPVVIVLTNYPYPEFKRRCLAMGARYFLNKATQFEKVQEILEGDLDSRPDTEILEFPGFRQELPE
jgi:DNA-binding NarL/FixJ family response regulator